jgi:hypothetical protein
VTRLRADRPRDHGSIPDKRFFSYLRLSPPALGFTRLPIWCVQEVPMVKRPKREAGFSPSSSAEVTEWGELHLPSHNPFHGAQRDNFTFFTLALYLHGICVNLAPPSHGPLISSLCSNLFTCIPSLYVRTFRKIVMSSRPGSNNPLVLHCSALKMNTIRPLKCRLTFTNEHAKCPWRSEFNHFWLANRVCGKKQLVVITFLHLFSHFVSVTRRPHFSGCIPKYAFI